jgi:hypothetical protein
MMKRTFFKLEFKLFSSTMRYDTKIILSQNNILTFDGFWNAMTLGKYCYERKEEVLKHSLDWVIETFPGYCNKNQNIVEILLIVYRR